MMEEKKWVNVDNVFLLFSVIFTIVFVGVWLILHFSVPEAGDEIKNLFQNISLLFGGGAVTLSVKVLHQILQKKGIILRAVCDFQMSLSEIGVLTVYTKRLRTQENGYMHDLIEELNNVANVKNNKHRKKEDPIKMIGVALESYFGNPDDIELSKAVADCSSSAYFNVLLCDPEKNQELRNKFELLSDAEKNGWEFKKTPLLQSIITSIQNITNIKSNNYLIYHLYESSPYATIIIVDESIYYTPNMTTFESLYSMSNNDNKIIAEYELSFRIKRKSKAGRKLEANFDKLWEKELQKQANKNNNE